MTCQEVLYFIEEDAVQANGKNTGTHSNSDFPSQNLLTNADLPKHFSSTKLLVLVYFEGKNKK